ncbi:MAG: hypothetical protein KU38_12030 [Sulfurovum sp. FS08-3]|nr:MAG: hypothetical protein KU38_12030 [Sulfurovum sp. FS08-3]
MSRYKIDSIRIFNFKVFDDFAIDFKTSSLVLLGGPNGYGKTTIFDAVELALTGNIERFIKIDILGSSDNIVAKDDSKPVIIKIILSVKNQKVEINRRLKQVQKTKQNNKVSNFSNLWSLELVENGNKNPITQKQLEDIIGENDFKDFYNSFFIFNKKRRHIF